jgi:hypothetical protein
MISALSVNFCRKKQEKMTSMITAISLSVIARPEFGEHTGIIRAGQSREKPFSFCRSFQSLRT